MENWFEKTILEGLKELEAEKTLPGWFSVFVNSNIPYIEYPFLSKEQNQEIHNQAKQVLSLARTKNQYKDTSITYNIDDIASSKKYIKFFGDFNSNQLMNDKEVNTLITKENENNNFVIIGLRNHPNNSGFSAMDILIFANNPSIKIMEIINAKGEISILARPSKKDLKKEMMNILVLNIPDIDERMHQWKIKNPQKREKPSLVDISTVEERNNITTECLNTFVNIGVFYSDFIGQEKARLLKFPTTKTISNNEQNVENIEEINTLNNSTINSKITIRQGDDYEQ